MAYDLRAVVCLHLEYQLSTQVSSWSMFTVAMVEACGAPHASTMATTTLHAHPHEITALPSLIIKLIKHIYNQYFPTKLIFPYS